MKTKATLLTILVLPFLVFSQNSSKKKDYYTYFDEIVGLKNTSLSNGVFFKEKFRKLAGNHNYFKSNEFHIGEIKYRNAYFYNVALKYDLLEDNLIVKIPDGTNNFVFVLEKKLVTHFKINNVHFTNTKSNGFVQQLSTNNTISLYKKHLKTKNKKLNQRFVHYTFSKRETYLLLFKNSYYTVKTKKDFITVFPNLKKKIKTFYNNNNFELKNHPDIFLINLCNMINKEL